MGTPEVRRGQLNSMAKAPVWKGRAVIPALRRGHVPPGVHSSTSPASGTQSAHRSSGPIVRHGSETRAGCHPATWLRLRPRDRHSARDLARQRGSRETMQEEVRCVPRPVSCCTHPHAEERARGWHSRDRHGKTEGLQQTCAQAGASGPSDLPAPARVRPVCSSQCGCSSQALWAPGGQWGRGRCQDRVRGVSPAGASPIPPMQLPAGVQESQGRRFGEKTMVLRRSWTPYAGSTRPKLFSQQS